MALIATAIAYGEITRGAFDVTAKPLVDAARRGKPATAGADFRAIRLEAGEIAFARSGMALTLDGIGKGRVVDGATAFLARRGYANVLVEAGGDLLARGRPWRIGIDHPRADDRLLATLSLNSRALATSGDYANAFTLDYGRHHIVDPRTGRSPQGLASATVLAPTATAADALSTAVMVLGPEAGLALLNRLPHVEGLLVSKEMELRATAGMPV